ncbi:hypothetical protein BT96DRAFT_941757 [Gymnopus androsaceus JB14]|uniref:Caleosin-domain-containing protein n=1 Tax=Gymnopus androsaceus JB14 TaxID=1447944 RepID=A0A6A4HF37_9AGAR|nr:hypothetical protein BT96DRAFT_941757 [Gymnopus androsaceus JB14]
MTKPVSLLSDGAHANAGAHNDSEKEPAQVADDAQTRTKKKKPRTGNGDKIKSEELAMIGHGSYFDANGDGIFSPLDTFRGFLALGFSFPMALFASIIICTMSYPSLPDSRWLPDPFFRIYIDGLHKAKHGSDSGSFRMDGAFDEERFDAFWNSHTDDPHKEIMPAQLYHAVAERRLAFDFYGTFAAIFEWFATWLLFGYPSFKFHWELFANEATWQVLGILSGNEAGMCKRSAEDGNPEGKRLLETFAYTGSSRIKATLMSVLLVAGMACAGGNVKKEDVKGIYNGTMFFTVMDRQADAGNGWARDWRRLHESSRALKRLEKMTPL